MSYILQFPPLPTPPDIASPPFVVFAIQDKDISTELPKKVPLRMVLHFAPELQRWVCPSPSKLSRAATYFVLREPYIGLNILEQLDPEGVLYIVNRMLQSCGLARIPEHFNACPNVTSSLAILKAWRAFGLPDEGVQPLYTQLLTRLMSGAAIDLEQLKGLWDMFPPSSPITSATIQTCSCAILREAAQNIIRSHNDYGYSLEEFTEIDEWIKEDNARTLFFKLLEASSSKPGDSSANGANANGGATSKKPDNKSSENGALRRLLNSEILERNNTQRVTLAQRKNREQRDGEEMSRRLRRLRSDNSLRSVDTAIFDPAPTPPARDQAALGENTLAPIPVNGHAKAGRFDLLGQHIEIPTQELKSKTSRFFESLSARLRRTDSTTMSEKIDPDASGKEPAGVAEEYELEMTEKCQESRLNRRSKRVIPTTYLENARSSVQWKA